MADGHCFSTRQAAGDQRTAAWSGCEDFLAEVGPLPAAPQTIAAAPLSDGRPQLWVTTVAGGCFSTWKVSTDPNAAWSGWENFLAEVGPLPAAPQALAVAPSSYYEGNRVWVATATGFVFTTPKVSTDPNAAWSEWANFLHSDPFPSPPRALAVLMLSEPLPPPRDESDALRIWVTTGDGCFSAIKIIGPALEDVTQWTPWSDFFAQVGAAPF